MINALLTLDRVSEQHFRCHHHQRNFLGSLFGGQVIAQAFMAAGLTCSPRKLPHSLHCYFLRPGHASSPLNFFVEYLLDGSTITNRLVKVEQDDKIILTMQCSFHIAESGYSHQAAIPEVSTSPEALLAQGSPLECSHLFPECERPEDAPITALPLSKALWSEVPENHVHNSYWLKSHPQLTDTPLYHCAALAFASDVGLLASAMIPHNSSMFSGAVFPASIDHAIWFHHPSDFRQWHLYSTYSPWAGQARALCNGQLFDRNGVLIASMTQEGLLRPRE